MTYYIFGVSEESDYSGNIRLILKRYNSSAEAIEAAKNLMMHHSMYHPEFNSAEIYEINSTPIRLSKKPVIEEVNSE